MRENLTVAIAAARQRGEALDHVLLYGPPGPRQDDAGLRHRQRTRRADRDHRRARCSRSPGDLAAILTSLQQRDVLFIDEIHRMAPAIEEILYPAMEDYELDIVIGQGPGARSVKVPLQRFTLVGATTRTGLLTSPLREPVRHRAPAGFLRPRPTCTRSCAARRGSLGCRIDDDAALRDGASSRAARRASPTGCCAGCATTRRCGPTARITRERGRRRARPARGGRARVRRDRPPPAAHDHREVQRRAGGPRHAGGGHQRREGRDRGHLRAVPDADRLPRPHAARTRRHAACLRVTSA